MSYVYGAAGTVGCTSIAGHVNSPPQLTPPPTHSPICDRGTPSALPALPVALPYALVRPVAVFGRRLPRAVRDHLTRLLEAERLSIQIPLKHYIAPGLTAPRTAPVETQL